LNEADRTRGPDEVGHGLAVAKGLHGGYFVGVENDAARAAVARQLSSVRTSTELLSSESRTQERLCPPALNGGWEFLFLDAERPAHTEERGDLVRLLARTASPSSTTRFRTHLSRLRSEHSLLATNGDGDGLPGRRGRLFVVRESAREWNLGRITRAVPRTTDDYLADPGFLRRRLALTNKLAGRRFSDRECARR
jgi:hypothetical protein